MWMKRGASLQKPTHHHVAKSVVDGQIARFCARCLAAVHVRIRKQCSGRRACFRDTHTTLAAMHVVRQLYYHYITLHTHTGMHPRDHKPEAMAMSSHSL